MATRTESLHKAAVRSLYTRFVADMDPIPILDHFIERNFMNFPAVRDIKDTQRTSEKNRLILQEVMRRDEEGYKVFLQCLKDTYQRGLATTLEEQYKKLSREKNAAVPIPRAVDHNTRPPGGSAGFRVQPNAANLPVQPRPAPTGATSATSNVNADNNAIRAPEQPRAVDHNARPPGGNAGFRVQPNTANVPVQSRPASTAGTAATANVNAGNNVTEQPKVRKVERDRPSAGRNAGIQIQPDSGNIPNQSLSTSVASSEFMMGNTVPQTPTPSMIGHGMPGMSRLDPVSGARSITRSISSPDPSDNDPGRAHLAISNRRVGDGGASVHRQPTGSSGQSGMNNRILPSGQQAFSSSVEQTGQQSNVGSRNQQSLISGLDHRDAANASLPYNPTETPRNGELVRDIRGRLPSDVGPELSTSGVTAAPPVSLPPAAPLCSLGTRRQIEIEDYPVNGRIILLEERFVKQFTEGVRFFLSKGAYGEVYRSEEKVEGMDMRIVIKKIHCHDFNEQDTNNEKRRSATNEILAARLMHFAIVPLLGMFEDERDKIVYFLFPYLEKGDLFDGIRRDKAVRNGSSRELKEVIRLKIIFHIASAMDFLHTKVKGFRGAYVHGDITTKNIVLDEQYNARLTDFGLARELIDVGHLTLTQSDQFGTKGYFQTANMKELTVRKDCFNFGVVLLELLTSLPPITEQGKLRERKNLLTLEQRSIKAVWVTKGIGEKIHTLAMNCLSDKEYTSQEILEYLKKSDLIPTAKWSETKTGKCNVCMLNKALDDSYQESHDNSNCYKFEVCASCVKNSYFNPIKCHSCYKEIKPPIGEGWAAILIAGNDDQKDAAELFTADAKLMCKTVSSRFPHVMGIREENVKLVCPSKPGQAEELKSKVKAAFDAIKNMEGIHTLLFYFTGHYTGSAFQLGSKEDCMTKEEMGQEYEKLKECGRFKKHLVFIDCCKAPEFNFTSLQRCTRMQLNACDGEFGQIAKAQQRIGSAFTHFLVQALSTGAFAEECFLVRSSTSPALVQSPTRRACNLCLEYKQRTSNDPLLSFQTLHEFVDKHTVLYTEGQYRVLKYDTIRGAEQGKIAYFMDECPKITFYYSKDLHERKTHTTEKVYNCLELPECKEELHRCLMEEFLKDENDLPSNSMRMYPDTICVVVTTGPKSPNYRELDTISKLVSAWNGQRRLHYGMRKLANIEHGKVGVVLKPEESAVKMLSYLETEDCADKLEDDLGLTIKIESKKIVRVFGMVQDMNPQEEEPNLCRLEQLLKETHDLVKNGWLCFIFPYKDEHKHLEDRYLVLEHMQASQRLE